METLGGDDEMPIEVSEYDEQVDVVADVPASDEGDVELRCDGRTVTIVVSTGGRPFAKQVDLPTYVDDQPARTSFNNGVLDVTFDQANDPANVGFH